MPLIPVTLVEDVAPTSALLFNQTLGADSASIDTGVNGVSQAWTNLVVRMLLRTTEAAATSTVLVQVNGSAGTNYDRSRIRNLNATVAGTSPIGDSSWILDCAGANSLASVFTPVYMDLPFYTATTALKTALFLVGAGGDTSAEMFMETVVGTWRSAGVITQLSVTAGSGNLLAGSRMSVYGVI